MHVFLEGFNKRSLMTSLIYLNCTHKLLMTTLVQFGIVEVVYCP